MAKCGRVERVFATDIDVTGSGPLAYEKANSRYNAAADAASDPNGPNWQAARRWLKTAECEDPKCKPSGKMIIGPTITIPHFSILQNPKRVRLTGRAGCTAILFCESIDA